MLCVCMSLCVCVRLLDLIQMLWLLPLTEHLHVFLFYVIDMGFICVNNIISPCLVYS